MLEEDGGKAVMGFSPLEKPIAVTLGRERWIGRESMFVYRKREGVTTDKYDENSEGAKWEGGEL